MLYDLLGITQGPLPRFAQNFLAGAEDIPSAVRAYVAAVKAGTFPTRAHGYN